MKNCFLFFLIFIGFFCGCSKKEVVPTTLIAANSTIALGNITSGTKASIKLIKTGEASTSFVVTSDKKWLKIDKNTSTVGASLDSLQFSTDITATDLTVGENTATVTITPTINNQVATPIILTINGTFKTTTLNVDIDSLNVGTIKNTTNALLNLSKIGAENLNFQISTDAPWLTLDRNSGTITSPTTVALSINTAALNYGKFNANINISYSVNNGESRVKTIPVSGFFDNTISGNIEKHTLSSDEIWAGVILLNGTVTVPMQYKLTIKPGTIIKIKKQTELTSIICDGTLIMNGTIDNLIQVMSAEASPAMGDWEIIQANADAEISYAIIQHGINAVNFSDYGLRSQPTKAQDIHHLWLNNNFFGLQFFKSNFDVNFHHITFNNFKYYGISTQNSHHYTNISECEFLDKNGYIDIYLVNNNVKVNIQNCNFSAKNQPYDSQLEVSSSSENNQVSASNCYQIITKNNFNNNNNSFNETNIAWAPNVNIGCGFAKNSSSVRKNNSTFMATQAGLRYFLKH